MTKYRGGCRARCTSASQQPRDMRRDWGRKSEDDRVVVRALGDVDGTAIMVATNLDAEKRKDDIPIAHRRRR